MAASTYSIAVVLIAQLAIVAPADVLVSTTGLMFSHAHAMKPLIKRIWDSSHNLTFYAEVLDNYNESVLNLPGINEVLVNLEGWGKMDPEYSSINNWDMNDTRLQDEKWSEGQNAMASLWTMYVGRYVCDNVIEHHPEDYWKLFNQTWDLLFMDVTGSLCTWHLAIHSDAPKLYYCPSSMDLGMATAKGLGMSIGTYPTMFLSYSDPLWTSEVFRHRFWNCVIMAQLLLAKLMSPEIYAESAVAAATGKYPGKAAGIFSSHVHHYLYFYPDHIDFPFPRGPDVSPFWDDCPLNIPKLPEDLEKFVSDPNSKGTIVFAIGSMYDWNEIPNWVIDAFTTSLFNLAKDYRIVWSYNGRRKLNEPSNVFISKWIPQPALLYHPRTKLFLSHAGLKSVAEVICAELPVVLMPLYMNHLQNTLLVMKNGFGEYINKQNVTAPYVEAVMRRLLDNWSVYKRNVVRTKALLYDRPMSYLDQNVYNVNRLLSRKATTQRWFTRKGTALTFYSYWDFDVTALFLLATAFMCWE